MIFTLSSIPNLSPPVRTTHADKAAHFAEYFVLGWLLFRALTRTAPLASPGVRVLLVVGIGAVLAGLDELYQGMVGGREQSVVDWLADLTGLLAAALAAAWWKARRGLASAGNPTPGRRMR